MLVAGRQINVERDGKLVALAPGEPVPEAATWDHQVLVNCMKVGQILSVEKATPEAVAQAKASVDAQRARRVAAPKAESKPKSTSKMPKAPKKISTSSAPKNAA
ncbi:MAG: hypothetical protein IT381_14845 [Deltaproteobacteria bacterium]|nr:hypothetical protein [Deltaproteobacteria bacterium]